VFTRLVRIQLAVFSVLTVACVGTVGTNYFNWGTSQYTVFVDFTDASGLYPKASVTYLGVDVGRVASLELGDDGVHAALAINDGTTNGSVIPRSRTKSLSSTSELLTSLDRLAASVPGDKLRSVLTEVTNAFQDSGRDLSSLLDSSTLLLHEASANLGPTTGLLGALGPVLDTQHDLDGDLRSFTTDLASFTDQLRYSDADLRRLIDSGPPLRDSFVGFTDQLHPTLPVLLGNLVSTGQVVRTYLPGVEQVLVLYPAFTAAIQSALLPYQDIGAIGTVLRLNVNDPPPLYQGISAQPAAA
jgi:phospholipid/cholesterol/gamma-HCH transport system substrate-binding protein